MKHQVFVSHSHTDSALAEQITTALEERGIICWIAPRDVSAGGSYAAAILTALEQSSCLVLIYTAHSNKSAHVLREVERAVYIGVDIVPVRFDASTVSKSLSYFLTSVPWLSALSKPGGDDVEIVADRIARSIKGRPKEGDHAEPVLRPLVPSRLEIQSRATSRRGRRVAITLVVTVLGLLTWILFLMRTRQTPSSVLVEPAQVSRSVAPSPNIELFRSPISSMSPNSPTRTPTPTPTTPPSPTPAATQLPRSTPETGLAGIWRGTITVTVPQGGGFQMPCEFTFDENRKEVSSLVNVDKHRGGSTHGYTQKGKTIYFNWAVPNEPGTVTNLTFTPAGDGKTASVTSVQYVRGQRIASGSGTFSKLK